MFGVLAVMDIEARYLAQRSRAIESMAGLKSRALTASKDGHEEKDERSFTVLRSSSTA